MPAIIKLILIIGQITIERIIRRRFHHWADGTPRKHHEKKETAHPKNLWQHTALHDCHHENQPPQPGRK